VKCFMVPKRGACNEMEIKEGRGMENDLKRDESGNSHTGRNMSQIVNGKRGGQNSRRGTRRELGLIRRGLAALSFGGGGS